MRKIVLCAGPVVPCGCSTNQLEEAWKKAIDEEFAGIFQTIETRVIAKPAGPVVQKLFLRYQDVMGLVKISH